jgi:hypothetical protein
LRLFAAIFFASAALSQAADVPGFGAKGAELVDLHVRSSDLAFTIKAALGNERVGWAGNLYAIE